MNVLFLDQFSEPGGAQLCLCDVLDEAIQRGWRARLLVPGSGPLTAHCRNLGVRVRPLPLTVYGNGTKSAADIARFGYDALRCNLAVRRAIAEEAPDLIYVNGPRALTATLGVDVPMVFHSHSLLDKSYARRIAQFCIESARKRGPVAVIATSQYTAQPFLPFITPVIIYNGVADAGFLARGARAGPLRAGMLGRIAPEKGHLDFVRAARLLVGAGRSMEFSITGKSMFSNATYEQEVREAARGLPLEFLEWTENAGDRLRSLDVLVIPSAAIEATPRVLMEALSAGTPVVAYPSGGIPEALRDGTTGILTRSADPASLADAITRLVDFPELVPRLCHGGRHEWETRFRQDRFQHDVCDFLELQVNQRTAERSKPAKAAM